MTEFLNFSSALNAKHLIAPSIVTLLQNCDASIPVEDIWVAEIDPLAANGIELCKRYGVSPDEGVTCVIVEATRSQTKTIAAVLALVDYQMDLNARRVSLAPLDLVLEKTQMEYGSITALGLPQNWPILVDSKIANVPRIIMGSGIVKSKLSIPSKILISLPNTQVIADLAKKL